MKYYYLEPKIANVNKYGAISESVVIERKSKFLSYVFNVENEEDAQLKIDIIRKDNIQARHVVYIYSYLKKGNICIRFSDDGEPQGTGTKAIYELLEKEKITNICIVIVRYFGGILLGAGLLSRTYLNSAKESINKCLKKEIFKYKEYFFKCSYSQYNIINSKINSYVQKSTVKIQNCTFKDNVEITLLIIEDDYDEVLKIVEKVKHGSR